MAEFKITRFRYTWKGDWDTNVSTYYRDDVVFYQGSSWVCIRQHVPTVFADDLAFTAPGDTLPSPAWKKMVDGRKFLGNWSASVQYDPGVLVLAGGNVYLCVAAHESSENFNTDVLNWEVFAVGSNFRNTWTPDTVYRVNDVVRYNGYTYQCTLEHTSGEISEGVLVGNNDNDDDSTLETWKTLVENYIYVGPYAPNTRYRENDLVKYGGSILKCISEHTTSAIPGDIDSSQFETYLPGYTYDEDWFDDVYYAIGDVVRWGGLLYVAVINNLNSQPGVSEIFPTGNSDWQVLAKGQRYLGAYDPQSLPLYKQGDVVRRGGSLWLSLTDQILGDDSTFAPLDTSNWELLIVGFNFRNTWKVDQDYNLYDVVYYRGTVYYATAPHFSSFENFPGDNGEGIQYWSIIVLSDPNAALSYKGDLLTYNLIRDIIQDGSTLKNLGDNSTLGPENIPIGSTDQLLVVENNQGDIGYKVWGNVPRVFFVRTNGIDDDTDPNRGINYFKPWRTLRYALLKADDGFEGHTTIRVSTGEYQEVLPLIIPARTAVVGEELRAVTIRANEPYPELAQDAPYMISTLITLGITLNDIIVGTFIDRRPGNDNIQVVLSPATATEALAADNIWNSIISTIYFMALDEGAMPAMSGSNTPVVNSNITAAVNIINANREFIKAEAISYMQIANPLYELDEQHYRDTIDHFLDTLIYDLQYTGNYESIKAAKFYSNKVTGSQLSDMFYVRDASGLRNLTLKGLEGTLPDLQAGETYRIPTAGAYVSLDPGWGPDDERVWITTRSCYVQNVTTFGTAAVGQKIDGLLHNGGNRSIVSNDFTQVISDGIGAWVQNGGRAELVSVFTYYAHIGMFAKDGGIIRATNGNSSYGDFGALADGIDPGEQVRYGYLNTRLEQAQVESAFAGEVNDFILALEFSNAGQEYSQASYSIQSSGSGAQLLQEEFRDNGMFVCFVTSPGSNFVQYGNQAQTGNELTITLATAENVEESEILGMRVILISGEGTGQYGYVHAYNSATKVVTVYRETDNQPGWDHILPGTPINPLLTTGTRYRIEPRPIFSHPGFAASEITLNASSEWAAAVYGETSQTFTNVQGSVGTGDTIEITPAPALFTVVKTGRTYSVSISDGGAGYAQDDIITIDGTDVGGLSPEHDITLRVTTISNDSTNSILAFVVDGPAVADSGKFILAPLIGRDGLYSSNGATWNAFQFPTDGNWGCLATGDNKFVAIAKGSANAASSTDGINWTARALPYSRNWNGVTYGDGVFLAVAGNLNGGAYSLDGAIWNSLTLPTAGDSTLNEWVDVAYGQGKFVILANSNNLVANGIYNALTDTWSWDWHVIDTIADSTQKDWISITYGNRRFVAISSTGDVAYSFNGEQWYPSTMPSQDGSTSHYWRQIRYGQGVFFAVGDTGSRDIGGDITTGPTTFAATSYDGLIWNSRNLATEENWGIIAFGNPDVSLGDSTVSNSKPTWIAVPYTATVRINRIYTGARALGRTVVDGQGIARIKIWEPGSGYDSDPVVTIVDPNNTTEASFRPRLADGVLAQPTLIDKGSAYKTSTTVVTVSGDGFADITPTGRFITLDGLSIMPGPGAQFYIAGRSTFFVAVITGINEETLPDGSIRSTFQVSPRPTLNDYLEHGMEVLIRERYSQVRITGHDFLDVGSGNFIETNYPELYVNYDYTTEPFQEVQNLNGGRVFYTSTDQDGNFRAGEQFAVEQATGIITISADFFDLKGLTELRLGGVQVGSTAIIREFSKDPLFLADSNNIIPTQRAIRSYLQSRLNVGGEDLLTPAITAGTVKIGPNLIESTANLTIDIPVVANFEGAACHIQGSMLAQAMYFRSFKR